MQKYNKNKLCSQYKEALGTQGYKYQKQNIGLILSTDDAKSLKRKSKYE